MEVYIIITICALLLFAYVFDVSSSKTKIPSVIILLALGWAVREVTTVFKIPIPDLTLALPVLGTVGLILIVLEGSLNIELDKTKLPLIRKSLGVSVFPVLLISFGLAWAFHYFGQVPFRTGLINAIPFAIISSAIVIPSAYHLSSKTREFATYESSLSDIFGVIFFNFIALNETFGIITFGTFILELLIMLIMTFFITIGLAFLLGKIRHHVKFLPIILILVLLYAISKIYHLPALIYVLIFGLFLGNVEKLKHLKFIKRLRLDVLDQEVHKFRDLTAEITFLIRTLFFLLFGFLINTADLINPETIVWAGMITLSIYIIRFVFLKIFGCKLSPQLFLAPRGLITILLFLAIEKEHIIALSNKSLVIQVIILTSLIMMMGLIVHKKEGQENNTPGL